MAKEMRNYKADVQINPNDLEQEWLEQPNLFLHYAEAHVEAMHHKDIVKAKLEYIYSTMYLEVKSKWNTHFDQKPTEAAIKELINSDKKYSTANRKYIDACKEVNLFQNIKTAFDHRKRALENLVSLRITGFHSEPRNKYTKLKEGEGRKAQKRSLNKGNRAKSRLKRKS